MIAVRFGPQVELGRQPRRSCGRAQCVDRPQVALDSWRGLSGDASVQQRPPHSAEQPLPRLFVRPVGRVGSSPATYV